jgi:hypothetical protein
MTHEKILELIETNPLLYRFVIAAVLHPHLISVGVAF